MIISADGLVFNEFADVLLIRRDDTRTLAPPGGACEIDELPNIAAAREVKEETGLIVHPVRLVGLYYLPLKPNAYLSLCFRCIQRGGELATSTEASHAGFFKTNPLPAPMLALHREHVVRALAHRGGPPHWSTHQISPKLRAGNFLLNNAVYPWLRWRRARLGLPEYVPPPNWKIRSTLIMRNERGEILWLHDEIDRAWSLPSTPAVADQPPWVAASETLQETLPGGIVLKDLRGIYLEQGTQEMNFVFTAAVGDIKAAASGRSAVFVAQGQESEQFLAAHLAIANDASIQGEQIVIKMLG